MTPIEPEWNPYESPQADLEPPVSRPKADEAWREGRLVVCRRVVPISLDYNRPEQSVALIKAAKLPDRCFKCNAPANGRLSARVLGWHHPAIYLFNLLTPIVYMRVAQAWRQYAAVQIGVCKRHGFRERLIGGLGGLFFFAGLALFLSLPHIPQGSIRFAVGGAIAMVVGAIVCFVVAFRFATIKKLNRNFVWIRGAGAEYLAELPAFPAKEW